MIWSVVRAATALVDRAPTWPGSSAASWSLPSARTWIPVSAAICLLLKVCSSSVPSAAMRVVDMAAIWLVV